MTCLRITSIGIVWLGPWRSRVWTSGWTPAAMRSHAAHVPHPSPGARSQFIAAARARAAVYVPAPAGPVKR